MQYFLTEKIKSSKPILSILGRVHVHSTDNITAITSHVHVTGYRDFEFRKS